MLCREMRSPLETPLDVVLRPMRASDIDDGLRLCRISGWNQVGRDWEQFLTLTPDGARVAEHDGLVVGTVATVRYDTQFGWIGMVLVDPVVRGRGVGTLLLDPAVELLSDMPLIRLDATSAGHDLYLTRNFTEEGLIHRLQGIAPGLADPTHDGVRRMTDQDIAEVSALDEQIFGANRATMLRWMLQGAPEYAWVARSGSRLTGYMFGRHGHDFEHMGPIVAVDAETARQLATTCLGAHTGRVFVVDAPVHTPSWQRSLETLGFRKQRLLIRMARGASGVPGDPSRQFAVLGPEFG
jgi:N-acetylglutamate synthase-like GNAT family acetyltransferase